MVGIEKDDLEKNDVVSIATIIKNWIQKEGIVMNEIVPPPQFEYCWDLIQAPRDPYPITIRCDFPQKQDYLVLNQKTILSDQSKHLLEGNPTNRNNFIMKILEFEMLLKMPSRFLLGGSQEPAFWEFLCKLHFDELTREKFLEKFGQIGRVSRYLSLLFRQIFEDRENKFDARDFKPV